MASSTVPRVDDGPGWRTRRSLARMAPRQLAAGAAQATAARPLALGSLFGGIRYPRAAFAFSVALIFTLAIRAHELVPASGAIHPTIVLSVLSLLLLFPGASAESLKQAMGDVSFKLTLCYVGWAAAMVPFSLWPGSSVSMLTSFVPPLLVMMLAILLLKPDEHNLDRLGLAFVVIAMIEIGGLRVLGYQTWDGRLMGYGTFDSNDHASIAALAFPFAAALVVRGRGWRRLLGMAGGALFIAAMGWFNSRGGTLAMGTGILTLILLQPGSRRLKLLVFAAIAGTAFWLTAPPQYRAKIEGLTNLEDDYNLTDYYGRKAVWARARGYIIQNPVTGVGISAFPVAEGASLTDAGSHGKWSTTHNAYLQAFAELGVPGGTVFVLLLLTGLRRALLIARPPGGKANIMRGRPEYLASLVAFCSGAYFLSHAYFFVVFCLLAMIAFATRVAAIGNPAVATSRGAFLGPALAIVSRTRAHRAP
ncbi:MAG TPA: O-antigen ligase family protein [Gemmatimonadaceae bacterium]|nr:O-antigen ligase family protein [Gemmatimonadaceae bacterium]